MQVSLTNTQKVPFSIDPKDADGTSQPVEGFEVDLLGADLTVDLNPDGLSGFIVSGATLGTFPIKFKADAKIGDGITPLEEDHQITVTNPEATTLTGTFGAPVPK